MNNQINNPLDIFRIIKNPKQYVLDYAKANNNPMLNNLIKMAEKGNKKGVEKVATNIFREQGKNFNKDILSNIK